VIDRVRVRVLRLERRIAAGADIVEQHLVSLEGGELRAQLGRHGGDGPPRIERELARAGAAELDILVGVSAVELGNMQEHVLGGDARRQPSLEIVADGLAHAEPGFSGGHRIEHVRRAHAARGAIEGTAAAGVRIRADQDGAGEGVAVLAHDHMADPGVASDIVDAGDAEAFGEGAPGLMRSRDHPVGRRRAVIEHDDNPLRVHDIEHLSPS
jgi:hypothetical protein